jgi:hypothetical protein
VARAARALWLLRGRDEPTIVVEGALTGEGREDGDVDDPTDWDLARVRRRLERSLVQTGLLVRRSGFLCLLAASIVAFRERDATTARGLTIARGEIGERRSLDDVAAIAAWPPPATPTHHERQACFDATAYDRLRVLLTELRRVQDEGGEAALRVGGHTFAPARLARLMRTI